MVYFDITANSFLPHQVRNMIGSLIKVGQDKMTAEEFKNMVESRTPGLAGPTAPAGGLCLVRVNYPGTFKGEA
jgi:tRNA pseudouridine38-40 synthase